MARRVTNVCPSSDEPGARNAALLNESGRLHLGLALVIGVVLIVHLFVADWMRDELDAIGRGVDEPKRMSVAYVRELKPAAPVVHSVAAPVPVAPAPVVKPKKAKAVDKAASQVVAAASAAGAAAAELAASEAAALAVAEADAAARVAEAASAALAAAAEAAADSSAAAASSASVASVAPAGAPSDDPSAVVSSSPSATSPDAPPFEWPASTRLTYKLTGNYRGEVHGTAQVEWIREGDRYQVHLDVVVGAEFAPLFTRKMTSDGVITPHGLSPRRYDEDSKLAFQARRVNAVLFDPDMVTLSNGTRVARPDGVAVQDSASQFVQLTWLFSTRPELLEVGRAIEVPLALPRSLDKWIYDVKERETLWTPFGALEALHLSPRRASPTDNPRTNALSAEIWFAPTLAYLPARIRIHQNADTYVDLLIARLPQMAAPMRGGVEPK